MTFFVSLKLNRSIYFKNPNTKLLSIKVFYLCASSRKSTEKVMIWKQAISLESLNKSSKNTLVEHLGIEFVEFGKDYLIGKMPVDHRTVQPLGLLHGGGFGQPG